MLSFDKKKKDRKKFISKYFSWCLMTVVLNELFWIWQFVEGLSDAVLKLFEQLFVPDFLLQTTTHCSSDLRQSSSSQWSLVANLTRLLPSNTPATQNYLRFREQRWENWMLGRRGTLESDRVNLEMMWGWRSCYWKGNIIFLLLSRSVLFEDK